MILRWLGPNCVGEAMRLWGPFLSRSTCHGTAHLQPPMVESEEEIERREDLADAILRITAEGLMG